MRILEFYILSYLLNSLWQVPLLFAAASLAARLLRPAGASFEHRLWVITLLLQSLVPACSLLPASWLRTAFWAGTAGHPAGTHIAVVMAGGTGAGSLQSPGLWLTLITVLYAAACAWFAARFLWRGTRLRATRHEAVRMVLVGEAAVLWTQCCRRFDVNDASIAVSGRVAGPVTMGLRRKLVLLPAAIADTLATEDLHTVIAHEFAHMRRNDFTKNLLYEILSLPVAYHPLLWSTRERIMETREMICDQMAAGVTGRYQYARSLLQLASLLVNGTPPRTPHTIGIFDANAFERRLMNLRGNQTHIGGGRKLAILAACSAVALSTCGVAVTLGMHADQAPAAETSHPSKQPKSLHVSSAVMSGNLISKAVPHYPPQARKAKIQGAVVLSAVIGKDGTIQRLRVVSGPKELQQSSLDAVRQWVYKPYLLNGNPVEVQTTVHIVYSLAG